eukprot:g45117.t1
MENSLEYQWLGSVRALAVGASSKLVTAFRMSIPTAESGVQQPLVPVPSEQAALVRAAQDRPLEEGQIHYLLPYDWWVSFCEHTNYMQKHDIVPAAKPCSIDNSPLLPEPSKRRNQASKNGTRDSQGSQSGAKDIALNRFVEIRAGLQEREDFMLVSESAWALLRKWYGGGVPEIARQVVNIGEEKPEGTKAKEEDLLVDVYPAQVTAVRCDSAGFAVPQSKLSGGHYSRYRLLRPLLPILVDELKLRDHFPHLLPDQAATGEGSGAGLEGQVRIWRVLPSGVCVKLKLAESLEMQNFHGDKIKLEVEVARTDGSWPRDAKAYKKTAAKALRNRQKEEKGQKQKKSGESGHESRNAQKQKLKLKGRKGRGSISSDPEEDANDGSESAGNAKEKAGSPFDGRGLVGLKNLGNTCYLNSALQCLSHTSELTAFFRKGLHHRDMNRQNPLGSGGKMAIAFGALVAQLWSSREKSAVSPASFKSALGQFARQFQGRQQHDSQEVLAFLLDGLHEDLNRVKNKPYVPIPDEVLGQPEREQADQAWSRHFARNQSVVVDNFQGLFKSTVVCPAPSCGRVSVTFDPFMYLSLPLPTVFDVVIYVFLVRPSRARPERFGLQIPSDSRLLALRHRLARLAEITRPECLRFAELGEHRVLAELDDSAKVSELKGKPPIWVFLGCPKPNPPVERFKCDKPKAETSSSFAEFRRSGRKAKKLQKKLKQEKQVAQRLKRQKEAEEAEEQARREEGGTIEEDPKERLYYLLFCKPSAAVGESACLSDCTSQASPPGTISTDDSSACKEDDQSEPVSQNKKMKTKAQKRNKRPSSSLSTIDSRNDTPSLALVAYPLPLVVPIPGSCQAADPCESKQNVGNRVLDEEISLAAFYQLAWRAMKPWLSQHKGVEHPEKSSAEGGYDNSEKKADSRTLEYQLKLRGNDVGDDQTGWLPLSPSTVEAKGAACFPFELRLLGSKGQRDCLYCSRKKTDTCKPEGKLQPKEEKETTGSGPSDIEPTRKRNCKGHGCMLDLSMPSSDWSAILRSLPDGTSLVSELNMEVYSRLQVNQDRLQPFDHPSVEEARQAEKRNKRGGLTYHKCFAQFTSEETLGKEEAWYCRNCKDHRQAIKRMELWTLPNILIVHLKRFYHAQYRREKITSFVDFPLNNLDLSPWLAPEARALTQQTAALNANSSDSLKNFKDTSQGEQKVFQLDGDHKRENPPSPSHPLPSLSYLPPVYELYAVSNHYGGLGGGHYTAYAREEEGQKGGDDKWWHFNDSSVSGPVKSSELALLELSQSPSPIVTNHFCQNISSVRLLFYSFFVSIPTSGKYYMTDDGTIMQKLERASPTFGQVHVRAPRKSLLYRRSLPRGRARPIRKTRFSSGNSTMSLRSRSTRPSFSSLNIPDVNSK